MKKINTNLKSVIWKTTLSHCIWKTLGKHCFISHSVSENFTLSTAHLPKERSSHFSSALTLLSLQKFSQHCLRNMRMQQVFFSPDGFKKHSTDLRRHHKLTWPKLPNAEGNSECSIQFCLAAWKICMWILCPKSFGALLFRCFNFTNYTSFMK